MPHRWNYRARLLLLTALIAAALAASGCSALGLTAQSPLIGADEPKLGPGKMSAAELQSEVMSFTDTFSGVIGQAWTDAGQARPSSPGGAPSTAVAPGTTLQGNPSLARRTAHERKLAIVSAAIAIATTPNPIVSLGDMITLVTLERMSLEDPATAELFGSEAAASLVAAHLEQEKKAWRIGTRAFTPEQQAELTTLIDQWRKDHPGQRYTSQVRLEDFSGDRELTAEGKPSGGSLLSIVMLDPLAGLDPAAREVQKSRLLGERVFFYATRAPTILRWQAESFYLDLFQSPEVQQALLTMAEVSETADGLPGVIAIEREAALTQVFDGLTIQREAALAQVFDGLTLQREALMHDIDERQDKLQGTLKDFRESVAATDALAASVTETLRAAESLADRVMPPPDLTPSTDDGDALADFRDAAAQTGSTADRLTILAAQVEQLLTSPALDRHAGSVPAVVQDAKRSTQDVIHYAFTRLLILVIVAPFTIVVAAAMYRWMMRGGRRGTPIGQPL